MTPSLLIRPVLALFLTAGVSACGMVESDPHRFESLANRIASVPLDGSRPAPVPTPAATPVRVADSGVRPAIKVEVMEDVALWDARYGVMGDAAEAAAPVVVEAAVTETRARLQRAVDRTPLRSALPAARLAPQPASAPRQNGGLVQLGAFSSEQSARAAWARLRSGAAGWALDGLSPTFEAVSVNGRDLVRLKVHAPAAGAAALCAAAGVDDPWCRRAA
ncbi:MAG: SPOR domain-containing protein [Brevundimonas sp.]|nr:MAG: SPOR domain-containing protein [Brevundimonas sp.]